ncbi:hypothetical protein [Lysinibacillus parviboronicapiens]|uniref:hypothetical protein n=1 Tax=Lysinibacillus parviboronicapiens TaxID=436516 RepID=UPI000D38510C|nr:hypothetical protein [Lysinibacillus parviboronicapiens]
MDQDLKELLRSVLKEELGPVNQRLDGMDKRFDGMEQRLDGMDKRFDGMEQRLDGMDKRFDGMEHRLDGIDQRLDKIEDEVQEVKLGLDKLQKNIVENLGQFTEKIANQVEDRTGALNKRVFEVETVIQRLTSQ